MGRKKIAGLFKRSGIWIINKQVGEYGRLYESTGASDRGEAEAELVARVPNRDPVPRPDNRRIKR